MASSTWLETHPEMVATFGAQGCADLALDIVNTQHCTEEEAKALLELVSNRLKEKK